MRAYFSITDTKPLVALVCSSVIMGLLGCGHIYKANVTHDVLAMPPERVSEHVVLQKQADDQREDRNRIGHWNFTLFAIEIGSVEAAEPLPDDIVKQVKDALEMAGYNVTLTETPNTPSQPANILKVQINDFYFKNYTWFGPLFITWGNIALTLTIENQAGKVFFARTFKHSGNSYHPAESGYRVAISEALTEILNDIVKVSCTAEFR